MKKEERQFRRVWIKARLRKNPKGSKKKYSRVKSHWKIINIKKEYSIQLTEREAHDIYDAIYMIHDCWDTIKLNKCDKSMASLHMKLEKIVCPDLYKRK